MTRGRKKKENKAVMIRRPEDVDKETLGMTRDFALVHLVTSGYVEWSSLQRKLFAVVLGEIDWTKSGNSNIIEITAEEIAEKIDWDLGNNIRKIKEMLNDNLHAMARTSYISIDDPYTGEKITRNLIVGVRTNSTGATVEIDSKFLPHFENLYKLSANEKKSFITFMQPDLLSFDSSFSYPLFMRLRSCGKSGGAINEYSMTTRQLKELFGLGEEAYVRKDGHFDRTNFEKFVINPAIVDINKSETITILPWEDGKLFAKEKVRGKVVGYKFKFQIWDKKKITRNREKNIKAHNKVIEAEFVELR